MVILGVMGLASGGLAEESTGDPKRVMLLIGGAYHDFKRNTVTLVDALEQGSGLDIVTLTTKGKSWLTDDELAKFDAVMLYTQGGRLSEAEEAALVRAVEGGKGFVAIHEATTSFSGKAAYQAMLGGQGERKLTMRDLEATVVGDGPIVVGVAETFAIKDEVLPRTGLAESGATVLVQAKAAGSETVYPVAWTRTHARGRVFVTTLGHAKPAIEHEAFQTLIRQGLKWVLEGGK